MAGKAGRLISLVLIVFVVFGNNASAQIRWDGEAGDGFWTNPQNWVGNQVPLATDRVILDNSLVTGSYEVIIGPGAVQVIVSNVHLAPVAGETISLVIPTGNTLAPALVCTGDGYGLILERGAIFRNASGASAGAPFEVADSIRINDGGQFIHNTARSHASNVRALSRAPGTEKGEFEFRIPVASSTISVSGQVFGRLRLMPGLNNTINYTGTGTNDLTVRSDLEIGHGVNLNFNLQGELNIRGSLIQYGGVLNLGTTARQLNVRITGDLLQSAGAVLTETGQAVPVLRLAGNATQTVDCKGSITNDVEIEFDNATGVSLASGLTVNHLLRLQQGFIQTNLHVLTLEAGAMLELPGEGYVDGRIKKKGLTDGDFMFPVGKNGVVRWVRLSEATGNFLVEFRHGDPGLLGKNLGAGLAHISSVEHWEILSETPSARAKVELSFHDVNSGGVTAPDQLRIAFWQNNTWQNGGNSATTGTAGSSGSVTGNMVNLFEAGEPTYFTLASSAASQNPLPLKWQSISLATGAAGVILKWEGESAAGSIYIPERSFDGLTFKPIGQVPYVTGTKQYMHIDHVHQTGRLYYRIREINFDGTISHSEIYTVQHRERFMQKLVVASNGKYVRIFTGGSVSGIVTVRVTDVTGRLLVINRITAQGDQLSLQLPANVPAGSILNFTLFSNDNQPQTVRAFVR